MGCFLIRQGLDFSALIVEKELQVGLDERSEFAAILVKIRHVISALQIMKVALHQILRVFVAETIAADATVDRHAIDPKQFPESI